MTPDEFDELEETDQVANVHRSWPIRIRTYDGQKQIGIEEGTCRPRPERQRTRFCVVCSGNWSKIVLDISGRV